MTQKSRDNFGLEEGVDSKFFFYVSDISEVDLVQIIKSMFYYFPSPLIK